MRPLQLVLTSMRIDSTGWRLWNAYDLSADGRTIVGAGINPHGYLQACGMDPIELPRSSLRIAPHRARLGLVASAGAAPALAGAIRRGQLSPGR
jgi:hypothetical protein